MPKNDEKGQKKVEAEHLNQNKIGYDSNKILYKREVDMYRKTYYSAEVMEKVDIKNFNKPDEVRTFPQGKLELVKIGGAIVGRAIFKPGWRWSTSVQPLAKTISCEASHFAYHLSGTLVVKMDDGTLLKCKSGDVCLIPSGHDAWVEGNEDVIVVDFRAWWITPKPCKETTVIKRPQHLTETFYVFQ